MSNARSHGFTLVELLISVVLGLLVVTIAMTNFVSNARSGNLGQSIVSIQSQASFALGEITAGVRSAGYIGCAGAGESIPDLPLRISTAATPRTNWTPINGFTVGSSSWTPSYPEGYGSGGYSPPTSGRATPIAGSDAILIEGGVGPGSAIASNSADNLRISLSEPAVGLSLGSMALIGNCSAAEIFHVKQLGTDSGGQDMVTANNTLANEFNINPVFPLATRVIPYRRALYFIGDTGRQSSNGEPIRALFEHLHPFVDTVPTELAEGVELLVLRYRQRDADGATQELAADNAAFDPSLVTGVTVGLLLSHDGYRLEDEEESDFQLSGVSLTRGSSSSGPSFPDDNRMRRSFEHFASVRTRSESGLLP